MAYLRVLEDTERLKNAFTDGARIAVLGGGWIGLEATSAARAAGAEVTVVESLDLPLLRVLGPEVAGVFADLHREHGVDLRLGARLTGVDRAGDGVRLTLDDGTVDADLLLVGIGAAPITTLAEGAGLDVDNGVLVDEHLRTSAPDVLAAGDIANAWHPVLGRRVRVEHWDNAIEQGKAAARSMLGEDVSYDRLPYFFTDQYDLGMEYVGHADPAEVDEVVVRGDTTGDRVFTAYWVKDGVVAAGMHANDWDAIDGIRDQVGKPLACTPGGRPPDRSSVASELEADGAGGGVGLHEGDLDVGAERQRCGRGHVGLHRGLLDDDVATGALLLVDGDHDPGEGATQVRAQHGCLDQVEHGPLVGAGLLRAALQGGGQLAQLLLHPARHLLPAHSATHTSAA